MTGSPGVGKSAVLSRILSTADPVSRALLPDDDDAVRAREGSIACGIHAKGKTALEVAGEIARAASFPAPERVDDLAPALREALDESGRSRFNIVIDALDEASPAQARVIVTKIVLELAETCGVAGAQVVVGTRRRDDAGDLLRLFGPGQSVIDLDSAVFFEPEDLAAYALATLQLRGPDRPDNPYRERIVAAPVAARIAELSEQNFLVAGLTALSHGVYDTTPVDPSTLALTPKAAHALTEYLERLPELEGLRAAAWPPAPLAGPGRCGGRLLWAPPPARRS